MKAKRTNVANDLIASLEEAAAIVRGEKEPARRYSVPGAEDVHAIRQKLGMSQNVFAARFGLSAAAVRDWEQGRRQPEQAARVLLRVIDRKPEAVMEALGAD